MKQTENGYMAVIAVMAIVMALLMCLCDYEVGRRRAAEERLAVETEQAIIGERIENFIIDVVRETDFFDEISFEQWDELDSLERRNDGSWELWVLEHYYSRY